MTGALLQTFALGMPWATMDPFLFCVHHDDAYPAGNERMGPAAALTGRRLGQDFEGKDGWRMYHGQGVPGFPPHPHRGFETVTIVRRGLVDHADSLGASARFGSGDVQWLTAGAGIMHSEMFPLLARDRQNPLELFQIWLNLPPEDKLAQPHFAMLWAREIPRVVLRDAAGRSAEITLIAGELSGVRAPAPPPRSWAARRESEVAIWTLRLDPGACCALPAASSREITRTLYCFRGQGVEVGGQALGGQMAALVRADLDLNIQAGDEECELLLLQGRAIGAPVVQAGPFVMNTRAEIERAFADFQRTRFGGWPWASQEPVHAREAGRFARHVDGHVEQGEDERTRPTITAIQGGSPR